MDQESLFGAINKKTDKRAETENLTKKENKI